jgi:N-succinyldiaminopimelate aminotransferase
MNSGLELLHPYPFEKLAALKQGLQPPAGLSHISLSIGEPKHQTPHFIVETVIEHLHQLSVYPQTRGMPELRQAIQHWLINRYQLPAKSLDADRHVLPVSGTREALFAFVQAMIDSSRPSQVWMPNPFYQIYEGAALLAGSEPVYMNCTAPKLIPDFDAIAPSDWDKCDILFICSPGNPTGAVIDLATLQQLIALAEKHNFIIAADECYAEIYLDENAPPPGLLQAAAAMGNEDYSRCIVFHSLSKRSNVPGMRSGFVAGDAKLIEALFRYRTYHGCAMPMHHQLASAKAWLDEAHVKQNRALYQEKFDAVLAVLGDTLPVERPPAGFYLWPATPLSDTALAQKLYAEQNLTVLPGSFLSRQTTTGDPGANRLRLALVAPLEDCVEAAQRIKTCVKSLTSF